MPNPNVAAESLQYGEVKALKELPYSGVEAPRRGPGRPANPTVPQAGGAQPEYADVPEEHVRLMEQYVASRKALDIAKEIEQMTGGAGWAGVLANLARAQFDVAARSLRDQTPFFDMEMVEGF